MSQDHAGDSGQYDSVHPVVVAGVERDASFQGGAPASGTASHMNHYESTHRQAVSPKHPPKQPDVNLDDPIGLRRFSLFFMPELNEVGRQLTEWSLAKSRPPTRSSPSPDFMSSDTTALPVAPYAPTMPKVTLGLNAKPPLSRRLWTELFSLAAHPRSGILAAGRDGNAE